MLPRKKSGVNFISRDLFMNTKEQIQDLMDDLEKTHKDKKGKFYGVDLEDFTREELILIIMEMAATTETKFKTLQEQDIVYSSTNKINIQK